MRTHHRAFTLIEVLATISIVALLIMLLLPAVQGAREAARHVRCANNLRQIGLALQSFEAQEGRYPVGFGYSYASRILPFLDQAPLYHSVNFELSRGLGPFEPANSTALMQSLDVFMCPSDSRFAVPFGTMSYPGNLGYGFRPDLTLHANNGLFTLSRRVGERDITDGTSRTVAASEWVLGYGLADPLGSVFGIPDIIGDVDRFSDHCMRVNVHPDNVITQSKGDSWLSGQVGRSLYNHNMPPNAFSCSNGFQALISGYTAGSRHPAGINAVFLDGHVERVRSTVDLRVWRALSTRAGGETY